MKYVGTSTTMLIFALATDFHFFFPTLCCQDLAFREDLCRFRDDSIFESRIYTSPLAEHFVDAKPLPEWRM